jgi:hypothetical protein
MAATAAEDIVNGRRPQADGNSDGGAIDLGLDALVTGRFQRMDARCRRKGRHPDRQREEGPVR